MTINQSFIVSQIILSVYCPCELSQIILAQVIIWRKLSTHSNEIPVCFKLFQSRSQILIEKQSCKFRYCKEAVGAERVERLRVLIRVKLSLVHSLRSKRFRASSTRKLGREQKKRNGPSRCHYFFFLPF